jgi:hypothetical protein
LFPLFYWMKRVNFFTGFGQEYGQEVPEENPSSRQSLSDDSDSGKGKVTLHDITVCYNT